MPANTELDPTLVEKVVARSYSGGALGERRVVTLSTERLGPAEDLAMAYVGLEPAGESDVLAVRGRQALGFAAWALVNYPENADDALVMVKRLKAAERKVRAKPGIAWEQYGEMARELDASVRHFLPPFWDEVARAFKNAGNTTYAARAIGKALEAERAHALSVDRERRRDVVIEFALAGALSGKTITEYTRDLQKQFTPAEALETFREVLCRHTLGGTPPASDALRNLTRLARAAGVDPNEEIDATLRAMLAAPSMVRAPRQFWDAASSRLNMLARKDDAVAGWLLAHTPVGRRRWNDKGRTAQWLERLDNWQALRVLSLSSEAWPQEITLPGGLAGWFASIINSLVVPPARLFDMLEAAAPRLIEEKLPLPLWTNSWGEVDVDVVEACLDLGIPLQEYHAGGSLSFTGWSSAARDHARRNSSLQQVFDQSAMVEHVRHNASALFSQDRSCSLTPEPLFNEPLRPFMDAVGENEYMNELWRSYLQENIDCLDTGAVIDYVRGLHALASNDPSAVAKYHPDVAIQLETIDVAAVLQRTLSAGVRKEYRSEVLELPTVDGYGGCPVDDKGNGIRLRSPFPTVIKLIDQRLVQIRPGNTRELGYWTLGNTLPVAALALPDDTLVIYRHSGYGFSAVWLSNPDEPLDYQSNPDDFSDTAQVEFGNGIFYGGRILRPGDSEIPKPRPFLSDGARIWRLPEHGRKSGNSGSLQEPEHILLDEIDPHSGRILGQGMPDWFGQDLPDGARILWRFCWLLPIPPELAGSPVGAVDGLVGWRVIRHRDGRINGRGIDGRQYTASESGGAFRPASEPLLMLDQPAGSDHWVVFGSSMANSRTGLNFEYPYSPCRNEGFREPVYRCRYDMHHLEVADPSSSGLLRQLDREQSARLLDAARDVWSADEDDQAGESAKLRKLVRGLLPDAPKGLVKGVCSEARSMAALEARLDKVRIELSEGVSTTEPAAPVDESIEAVENSFGLVPPVTATDIERFDIRGFEGWSFDISKNPRQSLANEHVDAVIRFLVTGEGTPAGVGGFDWFILLHDPAVVAWKGLWETLFDMPWNLPMSKYIEKLQARSDYRALAYLANTDILDSSSHFAYYRLYGVDLDHPEYKGVRRICPESSEECKAIDDGAQRYVIYRADRSWNKTIDLCILAVSDERPARPPFGVPIFRARAFDNSWSSEAVADFFTAVGKLEKLPLIPEDTLNAAAERLGVTSSELGLIWMGDFSQKTYSEKKPLTAVLRDNLGWKVRQIESACMSIAAMHYPIALTGAGFREDPAGTLGAGTMAAFEKLVDAWQQKKAEMVHLTPALIKQLSEVSSQSSCNLSRFTRMLSNPEQSPCLQSRTTRFRTRSGWYNWTCLDVVNDSSAGNEGSDYVFLALHDTICHINYAMPVADPARRALPALIRTVREWLQRPETELEFALSFTQEEVGDNHEVDVDATIDRFHSLLGGEMTRHDDFVEIDNGLVRAAIAPPACKLLFRPAMCHGSEQYDRLARIKSQTFHANVDVWGSADYIEFVRGIRSELIDRILTGNETITLPEGTWEQDPGNSVPELVEQVARHHRLSHDAARLYLQLLALPDPTTASVRCWNNWSTAMHKRISAELEQTDLVVSGKRSRAGRTLFLPGGWAALKAPNLPLETWKLPLYGYDNTEGFIGNRASLLVCRSTVDDLFRSAWHRTQTGDEPRYEDKL